MWDMVRADQFVVDYAAKDSTYNKKEESWKLYRQIFLIHNVSADQFKKSLAYYGSRPDRLRPILDSLIKKQKPPPDPKAHPLPDPAKSLPGKLPLH